MMFSPDGGHLYVSYAGERYTVLKTWNAVTGRPVPEGLSSPLTVFAMALSPDGRSLATGGREGAVKVRDTRTGRDLRAMRTFDGTVLSLAFRPTDGRGLAVAAGRDVWVRAWKDTADHEPAILHGEGGGKTAVAYSPDGRCLASCGEDGRVEVWDARSNQLLRRLDGGAGGYTVVAYSPDGHQLLAAGRDGVVYTWDAETGSPERSLSVQDTELAEAAFSPDGRRIATAGRDRRVRVWDLASGEPLVDCDGHESAVGGVRFSPDSRRLASAGGDGSVRLWDAATGQELLAMREHESYVQRVAFHPDGRLLASASADETVWLWDVARDRPVVRLKGHTVPVRGLRFSPDGGRLASASDDGTIRIWDVASGQRPSACPPRARSGGSPSARTARTWRPRGRTGPSGSGDGRPLEGETGWSGVQPAGPMSPPARVRVTVIGRTFRSFQSWPNVVPPGGVLLP